MTFTTGWIATVLEPDSRAVLTEQLRPPTGYRLVHAVGTTFTLDLTTLLSVPLAFAGRDARDPNDPVSILDSLRRHSDRIDVFCQAGMIAVPQQASDLLALLEGTIHPVSKRGGLFHPKVWVLEYENDDHDRSYRFLCGSRNLTGDRSWDLVLRLDSIETKGTSSSSQPIADFVRFLPTSLVVPLSAGRQKRIEQLAGRLDPVGWEVPSDVRELRFHPIGIDDRPAPDYDGKRHVVVSPFLTDSGIDLTTVPRSQRIDVVSRPESFDRLQPATLKRINAWVLDDAAQDDEAEQQGDNALHGLHAKAVILDRRDGSHLVLGSANATSAAYKNNVEFIVELVGPQPRIGVEAVFGEQSAFRKLLNEYEAVGGKEATLEEQLDERLDVAVRQLAAARLRLVVDQVEPYEVSLTTMDAPAVESLAVVTRLATVPAILRPLPAPGQQVRFEGLDVTELTPFVVLRVEDPRGAFREAVVIADLQGDVPGRVDSVLAKQLDSPDKFLRFLMLLLELPGTAGFSASGGAGDFGLWAAGSAAGVFESLVRAVGSGGTGLDDLTRVVHRLRDAGTDVFPDGFAELWDVVVSAHAGAAR